MTKYSAYTLLIVLLLITTISHAEPIKRSLTQQGTVEFSNAITPKHPYPSTVIYRYSDSDNIANFTDQKPINTTPYTVLKLTCYACDPTSKIDWNKVKLDIKSFSQYIDLNAKLNNIDPALLRAVIHAESAFKPNATSRTGAQGLMQLMPATAQQLAVNNVFDPAQNIAAGSRYLAQLLKRFNDNITLATAAYNAGPSAVQKYHGVPPYQETEVYVKRVAILHARYQQAL